MLLAGESSMSDPVSPSTPTSTDSAEHTGFQTATTMQQGHFMKLFLPSLLFICFLDSFWKKDFMYTEQSKRNLQTTNEQSVNNLTV